jgi:hypothetical protein
MIDRGREYLSWIVVLAVAGLFFVGLSQCMSGFWHFDFLVFGGDVHTYWQESLSWGLKLNEHHPPGFPILVAIVRTLTAGRLPPLAVMQSLTFVFLMGGAFLCVILCRRERVPQLGWRMALLYIAWPFVGSLYAVYPQKDSVVLFLLMLGILLGLDQKWLASGAAWGTATLIHPLAWVLVPLFLPLPWLVWIWESKRRSVGPPSVVPRNLLAMTAAAVMPLFGFWIWKTVVTNDPFSILNGIVEAQVASRGSFPLLDGWIGTFASGGTAGWIKIGILAVVVLFSVLLLAVAVRGRLPAGNGREFYRMLASVAVPVGILGLALLLNRHEIWAVVRFSKILILPLILQQDRLFGFVPPRFRMPAWWVLIAAGFLSQVAYAWYMVKVFFGM